ncbi:glycoside hydrolase 15-related [Chthoniobacter flavus Ellin428]|uniref:Trehalase n=1 Tax=Chthoniobacter flavus Ellin428 TaxID=497964 RepID=B4DC55_9BACT|nr:glycoside hydrolase family 15 protein [Chthoniobacter flavus]EDY15977.1 glycoside hydrolase 15-related [Chthoniobacter flavus Ellin428]TCO83291.1 GH15 family glucan-1,4-alpha-glucosidase [Chthoniobacter flavus]
MRIEDYAIIGDTETAAVVGRNGSIDWLCLPRFDSPACFAALLGNEENGCWQICPTAEIAATRRRYREGTLVLETEFDTREGSVRVVDAMPPREKHPDLIRIVEGLRGTVKMKMKLVVRFDHGSTLPWVRRIENHLEFLGGPDALSLWPGVETRGENLTTVAEFTVREGERIPFVLRWHPSYAAAQNEVDPLAQIEATTRWWKEWSARANYKGEWSEAVVRSLITLKALTFAPTGGVVAAVTTSLPERIGGIRNWDYRYCWLRDATFTLFALLDAGYVEEASAWRDWLLRAVAGDPARLQIMYSVSGERRIPETELPWLRGYEDSRPVRTGNSAHQEFQLDVYGELMDAMHKARCAGIPPEEHAWSIQRKLLDHLETVWSEPDNGIWEVRQERRQFTHSKVMAWVAFDRAIRTVERLHLEGPVERWRRLRDQIHEEVCRKGFSAKRQAFVQEFGGKRLDASLLMVPLVGFLPPDDERVQGTVRAIERELMPDGFVLRYDPETSSEVDHLPSGEGAFLLCSFWLVDNYALAGRLAEARELFSRLLSVRNEVGLLTEEYDPRARRLLGNFPQAFSHVGLINSARNLSHGGGPAHRRPQTEQSAPL